MYAGGYAFGPNGSAPGASRSESATAGSIGDPKFQVPGSRFQVKDNPSRMSSSTWNLEPGTPELNLLRTFALIVWARRPTAANTLAQRAQHRQNVPSALSLHREHSLCSSQ